MAQIDEALVMRYHWPHYQKVTEARRKIGLPYCLVLQVEERNRIIARSFVDPETKKLYFTIES